MTFKNILFESEGGIGTITLNRPEKLNALVSEIRQELLHVLDTIREERGIRVVILTGAGRGFCAGGDIELLSRLREAGDLEGLKRLLETGREVLNAIRELPKPVIAAVNGAAAGAGFNLSLACDIRIASEKATFGATFARIGLHPDWGGTYFLPRLVGMAKACELIFSGAMLGAAEAERIGLVNRVVPHDQLILEARALAAKILSNSPIPIGLAKGSIYKSLDGNLKEAFAREMEAQIACFQSEDAREGFRAFLEKRSPIFRGT